MGKRLGIISGSGDLPSYICDQAKRSGLICVVAGIKGQAHPSLEEKADVFGWFGLESIPEFISFLKRNDVGEVVFAGKIDPLVIFRKEAMNPAVLGILSKGHDRSPSSLINSVIGFLNSQGITVLDPKPFLTSAFCNEGLLSEREPLKEMELDIDFGWKIARQIADLDIGQTVIVKERAVVAVEGMEGTNATIKRGGLLAGGKTTVVKVSRTFQDLRVDLPAVGINTVEAMIEAKCAVLCIEAGRVPFFQKEEAIALADAYDIVIVAKKA
jgi:DUF1009 family protein